MSMPAVRARHLKTVLDAVRGRADGSRVLAGLPAGLAAAVEEAHGADWLPLELNVALVHALAEALGPGEFRATSRRLVRASFDGPLLSKLVRTAAALFGDDPAAWVRWVPHAWALVFRGCGAWRLAVRPGEAVLHLAGLPPACATDDVWLESVAASLSALLDVLDRRGTMELVATTFAGATYALRWEEATARRSA